MFQQGNQLARDRVTPKPFRDALIIALKEAGTDLPRLRKVASRLISVAEKGNVAAIRELADRLDGKVPQAITGEDGGDIVLQVVRYVVDQPPQVIDITAQSSIEDAVVEPVSDSILSENPSDSVTKIAPQPASSK